VCPDRDSYPEPIDPVSWFALGVLAAFVGAVAIVVAGMVLEWATGIRPAFLGGGSPGGGA
jgi:hypothetical protein